MAERRIPYAGSVHDEAEIEAVVAVLRGGPSALRIGENVAALEAAVAQLSGKARGVMCNSGSSALYLAIELAELRPGDEVLTSPLTFSTDLAPLVRAGLVPVFVDIEPDTYQIDVSAMGAMIGPRTRAVLVPDLIGNCPDWDTIRAITDPHQLFVIEDSCDCLGAMLRGTPTGQRSNVTVTSFALSHIITGAGTGGMVLLDDLDLVDRCLLLRRWGRRSEIKLFGSGRGDRNLFSVIDGLEYDELFIFDELGWNFEPSELSAAFARVQLGRLPGFLETRRANFAGIAERLGAHPDVFVLPRTTAELETAWHMFPIIIRAEAGVRRAEFQAHMESHGIDTRMVWTGNALRQPAFSAISHRAPESGLPHADQVMEWGLVLPCHHGMDEDDVAYLGDTVDEFLSTR